MIISRGPMTPPAISDFLSGGGDMGARMRAFDWSQTPLGPTEAWPQSLKTAVRLMLNSRYPMFVWWGDELTILYNDGYAPIFGRKHPAALGQPARYVWSEIWENLVAQVDAVMCEGQASWNEEVLLFMERNGFPEEVYFTWSYSPIWDETGRIGGLFCACTEETSRVLGRRRLKALRDLGERSLSEVKTTEQACRAAAATLAENPLDFPFALIYLLDADGKRARLSEAINLAAGTEANPAVIHIGSKDDVWGLEHVVSANRGHIVEDLAGKFGRLPAGPWMDDWTRSALVLPLAKAGGQEFPAGFLIAGISPRLAFNDDYRSFLELTANQLAAAIANASAYEEERKRAEALAEIDQAKTAFFSNVSHEFRTPLTLMLGPLEDLLQKANGTLSPEQQDQLGVAHRNSLRLLKLVNTLLDFSRIEAGRLQATYKPTNLAACTAELASVFRSAIERAGLRLIIDCPPVGEPVYIDREMWEKIVLNLLSNAFKFTFEGEIEISLRRASEGVELRVRDTGTGIPADELPHVFERFHRVEGARGRTFEGSGIGLALVQELVKLHGGSVRAESEVDRGSTLIVTIPLGKSHLPSDRIQHSQDSRKLDSPDAWGESYLEEARWWLSSDLERQANRKTEGQEAEEVAPPAVLSAQSATRILLADDNADMRDYMRRLLSQKYEVIAVGDGNEALQAARGQKPDLVLTDVMMPKLDGFGLLRELRADNRLKTVPVIMLSARAGEESRIEGLEAGADDYLIKPFSARELLTRVESHLKLQRMRHQWEKALHASQGKFSAAFEQSPLALTITSLDDGRLVEVNESFLRLSGYTREESLGRTPHELKLWVEPEKHFKGLAKLRIGESIFGVEARFRMKNGEERVGVVGASVIEINSRPHVVSSVADITERKQAEEALRQTEDRFSKAFHASPHLMTISTLAEGRYVDANDAVLRSLGYRREEIVGRTSDELGIFPYPEGRARLATALHHQGLVRDLEINIRAKDGTIRTILLSAEIISLDGEKCILTTSNDITERKWEEQRLALLAEISELTRRLEQPDELLFSVAQSVGQHLQVRRCLFNEIDLEQDLETIHRDYCREVESVAGVHRISDYSPITSAEMQSGKTVVNRDSQTDPRTAEFYEAIYARNGERAYVAVPLMRDGRWVASLWASDDRPRNWSEQEISLLEAVAERTWLALEKLRGELALHESQAHLQLTTEAAQIGTWQWNIKTGELFWSALHKKLWGYQPSPGPICYETWARLLDSKDLKQAEQAIEKCLHGREEYDVEYRITPLGTSETRWIRSIGQAVFNDSREAVSMLGVSFDITERKRTEELLWQSAQQITLIANTAPVFIAHCDRQERFLFVNQPYAERFGLTPADCTGKPIPEIVGAEAYEKFRHYIEVVLRGQRVEYEIEIPYARIGNRFMHCSYAPEFDQNGNVIGWVSAITDITEHKQAEVARERLAAIVESSDDAIISKDIQGIITSWNKGAEKMFGYTAAEAIGQPVLMLIPENRIDEEAEILEKIRRGQTVDHYETIRRRKDGIELGISLTVSPLRDETGKIIGASKIARDITERQQAEAERAVLFQREREAREEAETLNYVARSVAGELDLQKLVQTITDAGTKLTGANFGAFFYNLVNEQGESYVLYTLSGAPREAFEKFGLPRNTAVFEHTFRGRGIIRSDDILQHSDYGKSAPHYGMPKGHLPVRSYLAVPVMSRNGEVLGGLFFGHSEVGIFTERDERISAGIASQAAVAIDNAQLFMTVQKELAQRKQAEEALRETDRRKDEFLAMLAHELRNPLAPIRNAAQVLKLIGPADANQRWAREVIERQTQHLTRLVDDLLDVSRITRGKVTLQREPLNLTTIINRAVETSRPLIDTRKHLLTITLPAQPLYVEGDLTRLVQVVGNLLNNAAKFTEESGQIHLEVTQEDNQAVISVRDNGTGLSDDILPHVFDLFTQADRSLDRSQGGLGIGLTLVRNLVEMHGGTVEAKSEGPGQGSEFTIWLPVIQELENGLMNESSANDLDSALATPALKVLIVEDNVDSAEMMAFILKREGHEVRMSHDGLAALEAASAFRPQIVICDIGLPGMNGYDVAAQLFAQADFIDTMLIALSGYGQEEDRRRSREAGFKHHLVKPVDPDALIALLDSLKPDGPVRK